MSARPHNALFVITSMPVGGAETLLVNLVRKLDPERISPSICCLKERGVLGAQVETEIPLHCGLTRGKLDLSILPRLVRLMRHERIDAVITVGAGDKMFWGRLAARIAGVPVVLSALHSTGWPDGVGRLNRALTPITDGFIAVAPRHVKHLVEVERFPARKVFLIPNGVDTNRFQFSREGRADWRSRWGLAADTPVTGIVAALRPEKNHCRFLEIASLVRKRMGKAHFVIVGEGPQQSAIERKISELDLENSVTMAGCSPDIPGILSACDLFALSSDNEASPVSILEAQSCSRPVVVPDVGSIRDNVEHGKSGFLFQRDDVVSAADSWCRLLSDTQLRDNFGSAGRNNVTAHASLEVMTAGYAELIEQIFQMKQARNPGRKGSIQPALGQPE